MNRLYVRRSFENCARHRRPESQTERVVHQPLRNYSSIDDQVYPEAFPVLLTIKRGEESEFAFLIPSCCWIRKCQWLSSFKKIVDAAERGVGVDCVLPGELVDEWIRGCRCWVGKLD